MKRTLFALMTVPAGMLVVATVFLTLLVVGETDHAVPIYAVLMFVLTALNLWNEHRGH